ncbi:MAG: alpha/beta fold hydrolase [Sandaracinaceae bacterium]
MRGRAFGIAIAVLLSGCAQAAYFIRDTPVPMSALEVRMDPYERRSCLIVFMPGMLDTPDSFIDNGFVEDAVAASRRCDLALADGHFGYYRTGQIRQRVTQDILRIAEARGYEEFWIVGISMGGMGTLLVAQENASRIRGVVLLAPFLGDDALVRSIEEAGGLAEWHAPEDADPYDDDEYDDAMWGWLTGYATHPEDMPELYFATGADDARAGLSLLAPHTPAQRSGTTPGGHGWSTWRVLWQRLLASPPWDPAPGRPPTLRGADGPISGASDAS